MLNPTVTDTTRPRSSDYWIVVVVLVSFGMVAIFSIGIPFLLLGLTLAVVGPWRDRPTVLWPAIAAVVGFVVGALATLPWFCGSSVAPVPPGSRHIAGTGNCSTVLGLFHYGTATPSYLPGLAVAMGSAIIAAVVVHRVVEKKNREPADA
jgi:hypothetical protein